MLFGDCDDAVFHRENPQHLAGCQRLRTCGTGHENPHEQQIMWRLLWERTGRGWKNWDQITCDLNQDGIRTRQGRKITPNWARAYWCAAVKLLCEEKLLVEHRPPKMETFSLDKIPNLPKHIAEKLEAESRKLGNSID